MEEVRTNLIVNHLPQRFKDQEFHKLFSELGSIKNHRVMKDLKTGASFGYGFVDFEKPEDAAKAILQLNNFQLQNKRLKVSYASPPGGESTEKLNNLYVQNLPVSFNEDKLEELFGVYGTIENKLVFKDKLTGIPKGIAFVKFVNADDAQSAMRALNGEVPIGGTEPLNVKVAKEKDNVDKNDPNYQAGYQAGLAAAARGFGRGRGQFGNRGGYGRGSFSDMPPEYGFRSDAYGAQEEFAAMADFNQQVGKMGIDRTNNRYNPIGGNGMASYGGAEAASFAKMEASAPYRTQFEGYTNSRGGGGFSASGRGSSGLSGRGSFGGLRGNYGSRY